MSKKARIYVRKDGSKVAAFGRPVYGQLRFVASKRTSIDGKVWWCIFDNEEDLYVPSRYKMRAECEAGITWRIQKGKLPFVPYDDGKPKKG